MDMYHDLEELCEITGTELKRVNEKLKLMQQQGEKITKDDICGVDALAHTIKCVLSSKMILQQEEPQQYSRGYREGQYSGYGNGMYREGGGSGGSYNRGRDSMGRYMDGVYRDTGTVSELRRLKSQVGNPELQREMQQLIERMEHE